MQLTVATAYKNPHPRSFPLNHGMLRASGATLEGPRPCDWFDVFVDTQSSLVALLLDVKTEPGSAVDFLATVMGETRRLLRQHAPLRDVVNALQIELAACPGAEAGLSIVRISQRRAQVELLNAGMPAIASAGPSGQTVLHPPLSEPVGRRVGEVHAYELLPLHWGTSFFALSDGLVDGSPEPGAVAALCARLDLLGRGFALANSSSAEVRETLGELLLPPRLLPTRAEDATGVFVSADPHARFESQFIG